MLYKTYFQKQIVSEIVDKFPTTSIVSRSFIKRVIVIHTTRRVMKKSNFSDALLRKQFILENLTNTVWTRRKIYHAKVGRPGTEAREFSMRYHTCLVSSEIYNFLQILTVFLKWRKRALGIKKKIVIKFNTTGNAIHFRLFNVHQVPWIAPDIHRTKLHVMVKLVFINSLFSRIFLNRFRREFGQYFTSQKS